MKTGKKALAALLCLAMTAAAAGCGNSTTQTENGGNTQTQQPAATPAVVNNEALTDAANVDNSIQRESITIAGTDPGSLDPFDSQDATHVYLWSVYEPLFEVEAGEMVPVLADASRGEFGGYDHEEGTNKYTVYIYDYIEDSRGTTSPRPTSFSVLRREWIPALPRTPMRGTTPRRWTTPRLISISSVR